MAREAIIIDEATAEGSSTFAPLPAAWYDVVIEEVEAVEVQNGKNAGKEMFKYKFKVEGGDHDGRILFSNSCLWQGALFTQVDIQKAVGIAQPEAKNGKVAFQIAEEDDLIGKELKVRVIQKPKFVKEGEEPELDEEGNPVKANEVKSYKARGANSPAAAKGGKAKAGAKQSDGSFAL